MINQSSFGVKKLANGEQMEIYKKIKCIIYKTHKKYGWKVLFGIFIYYLVRDLTLYVAIPYFTILGVR